MTTCHRCGQKGERSDRFDAYFCGRCGLWLEGACGDPKCTYCTDRPPEPPAVAEPPPKPATYDVAVDALKSAENVRVTRRRGLTMAELRDAVRGTVAGSGLRFAAVDALIDGVPCSTSAPPKDPDPT